MEIASSVRSVLRYIYPQASFERSQPQAWRMGML
jgi:hypothetical protein